MPLELDGDALRRKTLMKRAPSEEQTSFPPTGSPHFSSHFSPAHRPASTWQPTDVLQLQRTVGNRAVANLVSPLRQSGHSPTIQRTPVDPKAKLLDQPKLPDNPAQSPLGNPEEAP